MASTSPEGQQPQSTIGTKAANLIRDAPVTELLRSINFMFRLFAWMFSLPMQIIMMTACGVAANYIYFHSDVVLAFTYNSLVTGISSIEALITLAKQSLGGAAAAAASTPQSSGVVDMVFGFLKRVYL